MSSDEKTAECHYEMHHLCTGPKVIRREGAPPTEAPLMTLRCSCTCHRGRRPQSS